VTPREYIRQLKQRLKDIQQDKIMNIAVGDTQDAFDQRVFEEGKNTGGFIFSYSKEPIYISDKNSPKAIPSNFKKGKTGKKIKSGYFSSGYFQYKQAIGRKNDKVDFQLSGDLRQDINSPVKENNNVWVFKVKRKANKGKVRGLNEDYNTVFKLTKKEEQVFFDSIQSQLLKILRK